MSRALRSREDCGVPLSYPTTAADMRKAARFFLLDGDFDEDSHEIRAAILIFAAYHPCGPHNGRLREFTGIPVDVIDRVGYWLRQAGIWRRNGDVLAPWLPIFEPGFFDGDDDSDETLEPLGALYKHVDVALGHTERLPNGSYRERMCEASFGHSTMTLPKSDLLKPLKSRMTRLVGDQRPPYLQSTSEGDQMADNQHTPDPVVRKTPGGWLATSPPGERLGFGVVADSEAAAIRLYGESYQKWCEIEARPEPHGR